MDELPHRTVRKELVCGICKGKGFIEWWEADDLDDLDGHPHRTGGPWWEADDLDGHHPHRTGCPRCSGKGIEYVDNWSDDFHEER